MTNEQETVELAPAWAHALATIVLKRVTTTIEDTFVPLTGREIDWPSQRRDTESLAKLIHLKAEAHYGNQHAADQATITTLRERLAAAEAMADAAGSFQFNIEPCIKVQIYRSTPIGTMGRETWTWTAKLEMTKWGPPKYLNGHATYRDAYLAAVAAGWLKPQPQESHQ